MKYPDNILELSRLAIDYMGFIFYEKSPRWVGNLSPEILKTLPQNIQKVGVFVNPSETEILEKTEKYDLQVVQLHGSESPQCCRFIKNHGIKIIKAFSINNETDLETINSYTEVCDYFLFDTKTPQYGGSGQKFDWKILEKYTGKIPFFLSGGIGLEDIPTIKQIQHKQLYGIDLNSRLEVRPGLKDIALLKTKLYAANK